MARYTVSHHCFFFLFKKIVSLFLIGGELLSNVVLVSAIHQYESAMGIHTSPPLEPSSHFPPHP